MSQPVESDILSRILILRGQRVMIDSDVAAVFGVETRVLNQTVKRNLGRFAQDFLFQLTTKELADLKSQNVISSRAGRRMLPYAFTEHGTVMVASLLNSERAIAASMYVVRAFVRLRSIIAINDELRERIEQLELSTDTRFSEVFQLLHEMMEPPSAPRHQIGFRKPD
jgi:predicted DNA binding protein